MYELFVAKLSTQPILNLYSSLTGCHKAITTSLTTNYNMKLNKLLALEDKCARVKVGQSFHFFARHTN